VAARWSFNGEAISGGEEMGRRNGESGERNNGADSFYCGRGGSSGWWERAGAVAAAAASRTSGGRRQLGSLTGWAHLSVRGRRRADWANKGGRRWAAAGLEKEGGGWAESIARAKIQNSKRKSILIDFWIKIGLEIE
jgi:hypothetical protein